MITRSLSPDIVVLRNPEERAVLVCGHDQTTMIGIPSTYSGVASLINSSKDLTGDGVKTAILLKELDKVVIPLGDIEGARLVLPEPRPGETLDTESTSIDHETLEAMDEDEASPVHIVRQGRVFHDDAGHTFRVEPALGSPHCLAVFIEPERVLVCCDDLDAVLPPRVHPGRVHQTIQRLADWRARKPSIIVPSSGVPIGDDEVHNVLTRTIHYLRRLYHLTRIGIMERGLPWERMVYTIPLSACWEGNQTVRAATDRHRENVRRMAEEITHGLQAEAEDTSVVA